MSTQYDYDVVIIGSGMGGLTCGTILAAEGMRVCVVEKGTVLGGCLQSFRRGRWLVDTGIHYVGSLQEGQVMHQYLKYLGVLPKLDIRGLDPAGFDRIYLAGREFRHAIGYDRFRETLLADFPQEREGIDSYCQMLQHVGSSIAPDTLRLGKISSGGGIYFGMSAAKTIDLLVKDPLLRQVLAGTVQLYAGRREVSPLYHHAIITSSNVEGASVFVGGTQLLADALADRIRSCGGELITRAEVTRLALSGDQISRVELNGGEHALTARWVISDIAPAQTFKLLDSSSLLKRVFLNRLQALPNTYGFFSVYLLMRQGAMPNRHCNLYLYNSSDVWNLDAEFENCKLPVVVVSIQPATDNQWADVVSLLVPMSFDQVAAWAGTRSGRRGESYEQFKARYAEATIRFAEQFVPGLRRAAAEIYTSTPLTYLDCTSVPEGSAYGLQKDFNRPLSSMIPIRSRISNLLLTGQNLNVHGMLGVTVSAAFTCSELLGEEYLAKKIGYA